MIIKARIGDDEPGSLPSLHVFRQPWSEHRMRQVAQAFPELHTSGNEALPRR